MANNIGIGTQTIPLPSNKVKRPEDLKGSNMPEILPENPVMKGKIEQLQTPKIPEVVSTSDLVTPPKVEVPTFNRGELLGKVTDTIGKFGGQAKANEAFVRGGLKLAGMEETPENIAKFTGQGLSSVAEQLGLSEQLPDFGVQEAKKEEIAPFDKAAEIKAREEAGKTLTLEERIKGYQDTFGAIEAGKAEDVGLTAKEQLANVKKAELDALGNDIDFQKILGIEEANKRADALDAGIEDIRSQAIPMGDINNQVNEAIEEFNVTGSRMKREELLREATKIYAYNQKVTEYNLAVGDVEQARAQVQKTSDDIREYRKIAIEDMNIEQDEKAELQKVNDDIWEKEQAGYVPISKESFEETKEKYGTDRIFTDAYGNNYLRPDQETEGEEAIVSSLISSYPDAGIALGDSLATAQGKLPTSRIYQDKVRGPVGSGGGAISGIGIEGWVKLLSSGQASISNVPSDIRNQVVTSLAEGGESITKNLSTTEVNKITDYKFGLDALAELTKTVEENSEYIGPLSGWQAINPWSEGRRVQANIDKVRQTVGKALEGGVLRKEDEEKYKKILATITDTPETAIYKLESLKTSLERDLATYITTLGQTGRFVGGVKEQPSAVDVEGLRTKYKY